MDANEFARRLERRFGRNVPVFTGEILEEMGEYSRPRVFQLLALAEEEGYLAKFAKGIYYIPTKTRYGRSILSVEQVVEKKYVSSDGEVYGIYAGLRGRITNKTLRKIIAKKRPENIMCGEFEEKKDDAVR